MSDRPDPLRYTMIGNDGLTDQQRLEKFTGPISIQYLLPHLKAGTLIQVHEALELAEVGVTLIRDDKPRIQSWLDEELIVVATEEMFETRPGEEAYTALVVSPFVLYR